MLPAEYNISPYIQSTYQIYVCPYGSRQVFSRKIIHGSHYLLFFLAIIHIIFSLITSVLTNASVSATHALMRASWALRTHLHNAGQQLPMVDKTTACLTHVLHPVSAKAHMPAAGQHHAGMRLANTACHGHGRQRAAAVFASY